MYIHLPSPAYQCGWLSENQCVMVLQNGDIHLYTVDPFTPGPDFQNGSYTGGSLWGLGIDYTDGPTAAAISPLGMGMVAYDNWLFPLSGGTIGNEVDVRKGITALAYSSRGDLALGNYNGDVAIYSEDASMLQKYYAQAHSMSITAITWSPSGDYLVTGDDMGKIEYWHARTGERTFSKKVSRDGIIFLACLDETTIIAGDHKLANADGQLYCFTIASKKPTWQKKIQGFCAFDVALNQGLVGVGDIQGIIHLWKPNDPTFILRRMAEHQMLSPQGKVQAVFPLDCLAFSPSSRLLLSCAEDSFAHITPLFLGKRRFRDVHDDEES